VHDKTLQPLFSMNHAWHPLLQLNAYELSDFIHLNTELNEFFSIAEKNLAIQKGKKSSCIE
jgi:DNA-directed RNA polymerase specialized sigma54-like protein